MTDQEFDELKKDLDKAHKEVERLQAAYRKEVGTRYVYVPEFIQSKSWKDGENGL
jgi:hypothetical protein